MTATDIDAQESPARHRPADRRRRASWLVPLVGAALLLTGGGLFLIGSSLPETEPPEKIGGNLPINEGATDLLDISANNSPSIARNPVDPTNLVVVNRIDTPRFSCAMHLSFDGGANWERRFVPFPLGEELPPRCYAPDVAFGPEGTLYLSFVTLEGLGNRPNATWIVTSDDGGRTLSLATRAAGPLAFQVRLTADPVVAGRLYLSWLQAEDTANLAFPTPGNPILFARSDDGGSSWSEPVTVNPPARERVVAPSTAVGPNGAIYLLYLDLVDDRLDYHGAHGGRGGEPYAGTWQLVLARSGDGGETWRESVVDDAVVPTERFVVFLPPSPSLAVDRGDGTVYAGFHDGRYGDADVLVWSSDDGGATFTSPVRVNDTPRADGTRQYMPRLAVAPNGRLDVVYYDRRADPENVMNGVSLQSSYDEAEHFTASIPLSDQNFDSGIGFGSERGLADLGSRIALLSTDERALAVWTDTRGGTEVSGKQDLARAVVAFSEPSPVRTPLRIAGIVLAALGLLGIVVGVVPIVRGRRSGDRSPEPPDGDPAADQGADEEVGAGVPVTSGAFAGDPSLTADEGTSDSGVAFENGGDPLVDHPPSAEDVADDPDGDRTITSETDQQHPPLPADEPPMASAVAPDDHRFEGVVASPEPLVVEEGEGQVGVFDQTGRGAGLLPGEGAALQEEPPDSDLPAAGIGDRSFDGASADHGDDAEPPEAAQSEAEPPEPQRAEAAQPEAAQPRAEWPEAAQFEVGSLEAQAPDAAEPEAEPSDARPPEAQPEAEPPEAAQPEAEPAQEPSFLFADEPPEANPPVQEPVPSQEAKEAFPFFFGDEPPESAPSGSVSADELPTDESPVDDVWSSPLPEEEASSGSTAAPTDGPPGATSEPSTDAPDEGRP